MKSIDIKSLLIGILGTALVMVLMGQSRFESKVISILQEQYEVECLEIDHNVFCRRFDTKTGEWVGRVRSAKMSMDVEDKLIREYE